MTDLTWDSVQAPTLVLELHAAVLNDVLATVGALDAESGGALGGGADPCRVSHFAFDQSSRTTNVTYSPDTVVLNELFASDWNRSGVRLRGFLHSHPGGFSTPSGGDQIY